MLANPLINTICLIVIAVCVVVALFAGWNLNL